MITSSCSVVEIVLSKHVRLDVTCGKCCVRLKLNDPAIAEHARLFHMHFIRETVPPESMRTKNTQDATESDTRCMHKLNQGTKQAKSRSLARALLHTSEHKAHHERHVIRRIVHKQSQNDATKNNLKPTLLPIIVAITMRNFKNMGKKRCSVKGKW